VEDAADADRAPQDPPAHPDNPADQEEMDSPEDLETQDPTLPHHNSLPNPAKDARLASQRDKDHPAHQDLPEAQDSPADQEKMRTVADVALPAHPVHPEPTDTREKPANPEDLDPQDKCTMPPVERDPPAHPAQTASQEAQDSPVEMDTQEREDHPAHPETMEDPVRQATPEAQVAKDNREARVDVALATTALHHALLQDIKPECGDCVEFTAAHQHPMLPNNFPDPRENRNTAGVPPILCLLFLALSCLYENNNNYRLVNMLK